ncbi:MAG: PDZ domain-containing protein [Syntrophomonadaceae bacterium]|nr:PDZ domain-containing protein [Syntrophomonadaceae bacterium]
MDLAISILSIMGRVFIETLSSPLFVCIYAVFFFIVAWQYKKMENLSEQIFGARQDQYLKSALVSSIMGLLGGILGSCLLVFLGIDLTGVGIGHLWLIAILLMLINPRFLCFAYAGGILALFKLITGVPNIDIPQLMGLIAVLHMIESGLILFNGHYSPTPVSVQKDHLVRGGFNLQKFWPIPLVALVSVGFAAEPGSGVAMPDWWPLLRGYSDFVEGKTYTMLPVMAILGYGEITTTSPPRERVKKSALHLFLYSLGLLFLAVASSQNNSLILLTALFSPVGHELIIWMGMREEVNKKPIYIKPDRGVKILNVIKGSPAYRAGIRPDDIVIGINGMSTDDSHFLQVLLSNLQGSVNIEVKRDKTQLHLKAMNAPIKEFGIIPVPEHSAGQYLSLGEDKLYSFASRLWRKIKQYF